MAESQYFPPYGGETFTQMIGAPQFVCWKEIPRPRPAPHTLSVPPHLLFHSDNPYHRVPPFTGGLAFGGGESQHQPRPEQVFDCVVEVPPPGSYRGQFGMSNRFRCDVPLSAWYFSTLYLDQIVQAQEISLISATAPPSNSPSPYLTYDAEVGHNWWERILGSEQNIRRYSIIQTFFTALQMPSPPPMVNQPSLTYTDIGHLQNEVPRYVMLIHFEMQQ